MMSAPVASARVAKTPRPWIGELRTMYAAFRAGDFFAAGLADFVPACFLAGDRSFDGVLVFAGMEWALGRATIVARRATRRPRVRNGKACRRRVSRAGQPVARVADVPAR
jgi:hypothetical protein